MRDDNIGSLLYSESSESVNSYNSYLICIAAQVMAGAGRIMCVGVVLQMLLVFEVKGQGECNEGDLHSSF